ncbi:guanylate-binding protein 1-like, partial [Egretta garzetta]|uniref:guanylate-binding protein 1-like n=1 Tax=Egretta garzetta TaxID=188379 RepID=UPI00163BFA41
FLPAHKCFALEPPASWKELAHLEDLQDDEISPEFQQQVEKMCSYIWEKSAPKTVPGGHGVTGQALGHLAATYVEAIRSGAVPCLESAVLALAKIENAAAAKDAAQNALPICHLPAGYPPAWRAPCLCQAALSFAWPESGGCSSTWADAFPLHLPQQHQVEAVKEKFFRDNEQASWDKCKAALRDLSQDMERQIRDGIYTVPRGYDIFREDEQAVVEKYRELPGKGVKVGRRAGPL